MKLKHEIIELKEFNNIIFTDIIYTQFYDTIFKNCVFDGNFFSNFFDNVIFDNCRVTHNFVIDDNEFKNIKYI